MICTGIIPARFASTRLPGKVLADIGGIPMIERVCRRAAPAVDRLIVAADDIRIVRAVEAFGRHAVLTSPDAPNGTARCAEALALINDDADIIVNIQADEPFIDPADITAAVSCFSDPTVDIVTLARRFGPGEDISELLSPDNPKVVMDSRMNALYFSRAALPFVRDVAVEQWPAAASLHLHVGLYAFRRSLLPDIAALPSCPLEKAERLEQLRWLAAGYRIRIAMTESRTISVDTPADLENARRFASAHDHLKHPLP